MRLFIFFLVALGGCWILYDQYLKDQDLWEVAEPAARKLNEVTGREIFIMPPEAGGSNEASTAESSSRDFNTSAAPQNEVGEHGGTTLIDARGRELVCEVLGKGGDFLAVRRDSDGGEFLLSISQLSPADQKLYGRMSDYNVAAIENVLGGGSGAGGVPAGRLARWNNSLVNATREAKTFGKPILMVFCADW